MTNSDTKPFTLPLILRRIAEHKPLMTRTLATWLAGAVGCRTIGPKLYLIDKKLLHCWN